MLVWQGYVTDLGRTYPMFPLRIVQENEVTTAINPESLLSIDDRERTISIENGCVVPGLIPRQIRIFTSDGAQFLLNYDRPFTSELQTYLVTNINIVAYEWIGERIKYGRLRKMLENV